MFKEHLIVTFSKRGIEFFSPFGFAGRSDHSELVCVSQFNLILTVESTSFNNVNIKELS